MQESDAFALGTDARHVIDEPDTCTAAAFQCSVQIINSETDVVNAGTSLGDEPGDWRLGRFRLEQLHERVATPESGDPGTVSVIERLFREVQQIAVEGEDTIESVHGDADVRDPGATWRGLLHLKYSGAGRALGIYIYRVAFQE